MARAFALVLLLHILAPPLTLSGPKQSRKPPPSSKQADNNMPNEPTSQGQRGNPAPATASPKPTFNAGALLDPKGASKASNSQLTQSTDQITGTNEDIPSGMGSMIENMNGLTSRSDAPNKKRKLDTFEDSEEQRKPKTTFHGVSESGLLGEEIKKQKKKVENIIDLTEDNDRSVALDEEALAHNKANKGSTRVILGMVELQISAHKLPSVSAASDRLHKDLYWKPTLVSLYHDKSSNGGKTIHVLDRKKERFARLLLQHVQALLPLFQGQHITQLSYKAYLPARPRKPTQSVGEETSERMALHLVFDAPRDQARKIGKKLKELSLDLIDPRYGLGTMEYVNPQWPENANFISKSTIPYNMPTSGGEVRQNQRTAEQMQQDVNSIFENLTQYETLSEMAAPMMVVGDLYTHQKQALSFMTKHEQTDEAFGRTDGLSDFSLWKRIHRARGDVYVNAITSQEISNKPAATRGGLLADQMGMGKTLTTISLICSSLDDATTFGKRKISKEAQTVCTSRATLVVCPVSLVEVWKDQINRYTGRKLNVLDYRGSRDRDPRALSDYDVVITSYALVSQEWRSLSGRTGECQNTLGSVEWFRVVLDEAHEIRNPVTALAKSCCALSAQRRWAVTGTPTQNKLEDLGTLIRFLRVQPFDEQKNWTAYIDSQLKAGEEKAYINLQLLVESITLRRTKDKMDQRLPNYVEDIIKLPFADEERELYNKVLDKANSNLRPLFDTNSKMKGRQYMSIFTVINQLRMVCAHGREMMSENVMQELEEGNNDVGIFDLGDEQTNDQQTVNEKAAYEHFSNMDETQENQCRVCSRDIEEPKEFGGTNDTTVGFITNCVDLLCPGCTEGYTAVMEASMDGYAKCPICNTHGLCGMVELSAKGFERTRIERERAEDFKAKKIKWTPDTYSGPHTKVTELIKDLKASVEESAALPEGEPPIRSVVFSGWTQMLDLVAYALKLEGMQYSRIDGTMTSTKRGEEIASFNSNPVKRIFLVSIKAGGQGINLEAANKAYMLEPQYNPGVEQQAFQRVHRIGQKREVVVRRYVMENTVEEGVIRLQKKKNEIASKSMERRGTKVNQKERQREDLKMIFQ